MGLPAVAARPMTRKVTVRMHKDLPRAREGNCVLRAAVSALRNIDAASQLLPVC